MLFSFVYFFSTDQLSRQTHETIEAEILGLSEQYANGGISQLAATINKRSRSPGAGLYFVGDGHGSYIVGNMENLPKDIDAADGWVEFFIDRASDADETKTDSTQHAARARLFQLSEGAILLVGRDIQSRRDIEQTLKNALIWGLIATLFIGVIGGIFAGQWMLNRVDSTSVAANEIAAGDLNGRLPISQNNDEIDRLSTTFNSMLGRIDRLRTGMTEVSDNIAHDLRSPLARVRAEAEDAFVNASTLDEAKASLSFIIAEVDRLLGVFTSLLSIARLESGAKQEPFDKIDISAMMIDLAELYEPSTVDGELLFEANIEPNITTNADRTLLSQAVANLIENALRYGRKTVHLTLHRGTDFIEISVADRGSGIPTDKHSVVFERFSRLDSQRTTPGSGLGLSLVRAIATSHGGHVTLNDNHPGLRATINLPIPPC